MPFLLSRFVRISLDITTGRLLIIWKEDMGLEDVRYFV